MDPFISEIRIFTSNFAPKGWAFCDGSILPIQQNTALFSLLGTYYGGDGDSTFALPDLRGRVPLQPGQGPGLSPYDLGQSGGQEAVTLLENNIPSHTHTLLGAPVAANVPTPTPGSLFANAAGSRGQQGPAVYTVDAPNANLAPMAITPTGGSQPVSIMKPVLSLNYIIALQGVFPSRP